jgi:hypothetical protein
MGNPVDTMRRTLAELEAQREQIDATIAQLRTMLASWTGTHESGPPSAREPSSKRQRQGRNGNLMRAPVLVFEQKYEAPARDLIGNLLRESRNSSLHAGEVGKRLASRGYDFKKQTINLGLKQLVEAGKVKKIKAEAGSGHSWVYSWVANELPFDEGEAHA